MDCSIKSYITPRSAAKLLIADEIDLLTAWSNKETKYILDSLLKLSTDELLSIVDTNRHGIKADVKYIPQFGKIETILCIPRMMYEKGKNNLDYAQLGLLLKNDPYATLDANMKFGENHGKIAAMTGIVTNIEHHIVPSSLTKPLVELYSEDEQYEILRRLFLRVPIIQILLRAAKTGPVNGYSPMEELKESTQKRRSTSIKAILAELRELDDVLLNERIDNVVWK